MKRTLCCTLIAWCLWSLGTPLSADPTRPQARHYLLRSAWKPEDLQMSLSDGAASGFRLLDAWSSPAEMLALMEREDAPPAPREYLVLAAYRLGADMDADTDRDFSSLGSWDSGMETQERRPRPRGERIVGKADELQEALSTLAAGGYRFVDLADRSKRETERGQQGVPSYRVHYVVVGERPAGANPSGALGIEPFRVIAATPNAGLLERAPDAQTEYEHLIRRRSGDLHEAIHQHRSEGLSLVGTASSWWILANLRQDPSYPYVHTAVMARPRGPLNLPPGSPPEVPFSRRTVRFEQPGGAVEEALDEAGAQGYEIHAVLRYALRTGNQELCLVLERSEVSHDPLRYGVLGTRSLSTLEKEMNELAADGFRLHPGGVYLNIEWVAIMAARPGNPIYEYRMLSTQRQSTLRREIAEAVAEGFELVARPDNPSGYVVFLERPITR